MPERTPREKLFCRGRTMFKRGLPLPWTVILFAVFAVTQASAQRVTEVEPTTCKAGDTVTVKGEKLREKSLKELMLSRDGKTHRVEIVQKADDRITMKVPKVPPGEYKLALKIDDNIYVEPVGVTVE